MSQRVQKRPSENTTDGVLPVKRQRKEYVSKKELARLKATADGNHASTITVTDADHDPWAVVDPIKPEEDKFNFLPKKQKLTVPKSMRQAPISLAANGKVVKAVPIPAGGHSYNPHADDHDELLKSLGAREVEHELKRQREAEEERLRKEAAARSAAEAEAAEARAELSEWDEDSAWEGFESGVEDVNVKKKQPQRKTQAQRNKIKRRMEEERLAKHEAAMRKRKNQEQQIKSIAKEVEEEHQAALAKIELSDQDEEGDDMELRRRQLGRFRLPEKDLEVVLPDELEDSLRKLKPEGNLLKDRYRSMLVRGKMEARGKRPFRKQKKAKVTEKWTHKDFSI